MSEELELFIVKYELMIELYKEISILRHEMDRTKDITVLGKERIKYLSDLIEEYKGHIEEITESVRLKV